MEISRLLHAPASDNQLQDSQERDKNSKSAKQKARPATRKRPWRPSLKQLRAKSQRDADNSLFLNLTLDVNDLRQQVHDCLVQKSIRETRLLVAREQFHARSLLSVDGFFKTVFPNSLQDDALVKQVLHRRFVCPTKTLISIGADGRLVQYDAFSDVFEAMSKLLDFNPLRLVTLMADAAISDGSMLPFVDDCINLDHDGEEEGNVGGVSPVSGKTSSRSSIDFILS
ncbi:hypothetical protein JG688_00005557 [Phytophthora aleatoria]|uniref:Uncharacterized protein n=1 Tax=Phytophthora aleatoria TaxID=2496075 RepID=A0A8J5M8H5_9STRA|nr:hypothetical protein JG688_00005557 [Phytophthora aleatoria]